MTSRTPMGAQPRPPQQRSASSSSLSGQQRPPHQRSISQQHLQQQQQSQQQSSSQQQQSQQHNLPASPVRKDSTSSFVDLTADAPDGTPNRFISTPRRGGSRLKIELSHEASSGPLSATNSPQSLTPSRIQPMSEAFDGSVASPAVSRISHQDVDNPPLPMPRRRPRASASVPTAAARRLQAAPAAAKKDGRPKPYTTQTPALAPRYMAPRNTDNSDAKKTPGDLFSKGLNSGYADFFPWTGNHHEDEWNAEAITKGTWDKANINVPETSSAKLSIFPALKQKSGLNALSTIFMGVLNQRRHRGQVTTSSTFKPPPRVTLTDSKREAWLKDLANPAISLRRLSRTIPHGVRGRTLLDQCLNKDLPTERAVWLARCVGANEIRAFKRKGVNGAFVMGGELKWLRDWTVFVEQFVDATAAAFGEDDWKARVTYAIRLATSLYSEQLLDRDHYLDWVVSGIENSSQTRMPMWILIAQIYWKDLLRSRKYGRRLVYALLSHLQVIQQDPDQDLLAPLLGRLAPLLSSLTRSNPESFIYPSAWPKYREALQGALPPDDESAQHAFDQIHIRNSSLVVSSATSSPAGRSQLVKLLDAALMEPVDRNLPKKCWETNDDKSAIVKTLVDWATSFHRPGLAKVYLAANLIRIWSTFRINATTVILEALDGISAQDTSHKNLVYHLVAELVRTGHFSVPQYMQWVIARGGYHSAADIDPNDGACATRLLVELPIHALSDKKKSERGNLLRRAGNYSVAEEEMDINNALRIVDHALGLPLPENDTLSQRKPAPIKKLLKRIGHSNMALKCCLGAHLRDAFNKQSPGIQQSPMAVTAFTAVRDIMETAEDFTMLSHILGTCIKSADPDVLACCADTINSNLRIFYALGSAEDLFSNLIERLRATSEEQGIVPRAPLAALSSLAQRIAGQEATAAQLREELLQCDKNNAIDACSPVSDIMATPSQSAEGEIVDEIEKQLSSGTRLDPPTMNRLFRTIIPRLERGWAKKDETRRVFATLLARIRVFDTQHFDKLMTDWTSHIRSLPQRPPLSDLFPLLISTGCLAMPIILSTASAPSASQGTTSDSASAQPGAATYLQELFRLVINPVPANTGLFPEERYRFGTEQKCAKLEQSKGLLNLIRNALMEFSGFTSYDGDLSLPFSDEACIQSLLETLRLLVLVDSNAVSQALSIKSLPTEAAGLIRKVTTSLLIPGQYSDAETSFDRILQLANELTLPFCQLKLNLDLSMSQMNPSEGGDSQQGQSRFDLFAKAMDRAIESGNIMWTSLLPSLSDDITQHLKSQAQAGFLELVPSLKTEGAAPDSSIHMAQNLLGVVEAIILGQAAPKSAQLTTPMADKLTDLWETVSGGAGERPEVFASVLQHWLPAMLRFITLHSVSAELPAAPLAPTAAPSSRPPANASHDVRARLILVLCGLLLDLEALPAETVGSLPQRIFDMALLLVDTLPEELRAQAAKAVLFLPGGLPSTSTSSDPRLHYLFSAPPPSPTDNLLLSHREKAATPQSATARSMGAMYGIGPAVAERLSPYVLRRWELLSEPTPIAGENDTSLNLKLFDAIKI